MTQQLHGNIHYNVACVIGKRSSTNLSFLYVLLPKRPNHYVVSVQDQCNYHYHCWQCLCLVQKIVTLQVASGAEPDITSCVDIFRRMPGCGRITDFALWTSIDDRIWLNDCNATEKGSASEHDPWRVTMQRTDNILVNRYSSYFSPQAAHYYQTSCSIDHRFL